MLNYSVAELRFKKDIAIPIVHITLGLLIAAIILQSFSAEWGVIIKWKTYWVILGAVLAMLGGSFIVNVNTHRRTSIYIGNNRSQTLFHLNKSKLICIFVFIVMVNLLKAYLLMQYYGTSNLAIALGLHTTELKFGDSSFRMPFGFGFISLVANGLGTLCGYLLPLYWSSHKYKIEKFWLLVIFMFSCVFSLLSSGRSPLLWLLLTLFISICIKQQISKGKVKLKYILLVMTFGVVFLYSFQGLGHLIGREVNENHSVLYDIGVYCGAEIYNLDCYIEEVDKVNNIIGEETFYYFYSFLDKIGVVEIKQKPHADYLQFIFSPKGYDLGNVATCFKPYYKDFGFVGCLIFCFIIGICMHWLYCKVIRSKYYLNGIMGFHSYMFISVCPAAFMSFFGESIVENYMNWLDIRYLLQYVLVFYIFYGVFPWKKTILKDEKNYNVSRPA